MSSFPVAFRSQQQAPDARFPVVAARGSACPVVLAAEDGDVRWVAVRALSVQAQREGHVRETFAIRRGAGDVLVTDARVVLVGSRPTTDTLMTGHVLLDWIVAVGGCTSGSRFRDDALRLVLQFEDGEYHVVTLTFEDDVDVHELAQDIARRTARRWLSVQGASSLVRDWETLAEAPRLVAEEGEFALHVAPSHTRVAAPAIGLERGGVPA